MTNPLDDLAQFSSTSLPRVHTSGRRELRQQRLARGLTVTARARTAEEQLAAQVRGEMVRTLPIKRVTPKREGMTKKEWKRARRMAREAGKEQCSQKEN